MKIIDNEKKNPNMIDPSLDKLIGLVDSKYTLVVLAAKRAREIVEEDNSTLNTKLGKPVTTSLHEISASKIEYERIDDGIK